MSGHELFFIDSTAGGNIVELSDMVDAISGTHEITFTIENSAADAIDILDLGEFRIPFAQVVDAPVQALDYRNCPNCSQMYPLEDFVGGCPRCGAPYMVKDG